MRSFEVTQGQKMPIKGHKGRIPIFIKSSQIIDEKEALNVSFSKTLVSRSFKVTQGRKLSIKGHKGQVLIFIKSSQNIDAEGILINLLPWAMWEAYEISPIYNLERLSK